MWEIYDIVVIFDLAVFWGVFVLEGGGYCRTPSELYFRMKRAVQSSIRVTPMPKLIPDLPPR
jgi:hypothetical protein